MKTVGHKCGKNFVHYPLQKEYNDKHLHCKFMFLHSFLNQQSMLRFLTISRHSELFKKISIILSYNITSTINTRLNFFKEGLFYFEHTKIRSKFFHVRSLGNLITNADLFTIFVIISFLQYLK